MSFADSLPDLDAAAQKVLEENEALSVKVAVARARLSRAHHQRGLLSLELHQRLNENAKQAAELEDNFHIPTAQR